MTEYIKQLEATISQLQIKIEKVQKEADRNAMAANVLREILKVASYDVTKATSSSHVLCLEVGEVVISDKDIGYFQVKALEDLIDEINKKRPSIDLTNISDAFKNLCLVKEEAAARIRPR